MRWIESIARVIAGGVGWLGGAVMLLMMLQVSMDVICKYFLNWPIPATLETVSGYYMVALVFLPLGLVTRDEDHLEVELFTQGLRPRPLAAVKLLGCLIGIVYVAIMGYRGGEEAIHMTRIGEVWETATWNMRIWPARWLFPLGCGLMLVWLVLHAIDNAVFAAAGRRVLTVRRGHAPTEETAA